MSPCEREGMGQLPMTSNGPSSRVTGYEITRFRYVLSAATGLFFRTFNNIKVEHYYPTNGKARLQVANGP